eukprot:1156426-Pelagomonas_calceolata.AAC.2
MSPVWLGKEHGELTSARWARAAVLQAWDAGGGSGGWDSLARAQQCQQRRGYWRGGVQGPAAKEVGGISWPSSNKAGRATMQIVGSACQIIGSTFMAHLRFKTNLSGHEDRVQRKACNSSSFQAEGCHFCAL